jgi:hypothetical protein
MLAVGTAGARAAGETDGTGAVTSAGAVGRSDGLATAARSPSTRQSLQ